MAQEDLKAIAKDLEALRDAARGRMNVTADKDESDRLFLQILEINHRLQMINAVFLKAGTEALSVHVDKIAAASQQVSEAISAVDGLARAIEGIKTVLSLVDIVIDIVA